MSVVESPLATNISPGPLAEQIRTAARSWSAGQRRLVVLAAEFADSAEWVLDGSPTPAHWIAAVSDVEIATAREWIRIGHRLHELPLIAEAYAAGAISYSKVRALTRVATPENEHELVDIALAVPAGELGRSLSAWLHRNIDAAELAAHHERRRSITWRTEPDGMVTFTMRLAPLLAGVLVAVLTKIVMRSATATTRGGANASADAFPALAQQYSDALAEFFHEGTGKIDTEIVLHARADGCSLDDGTPIPDTVVERLVPSAFLRALIHDANGRPINASARRRHPSTRQKRVVKDRDRVCRDCGNRRLLEYDHVPAHELSRHTVVEELELRCAPCHRARHG